MSIRFDGFDELKRKLEGLARRVERLGGERELAFKELFPPSFMRSYTKFGTIEEMLTASPWKVESQEDFKAIPDAEWDEFVRQATRFQSWEKMLGQAVEEYVGRELGLK